MTDCAEARPLSAVSIVTWLNKSEGTIIQRENQTKVNDKPEWKHESNNPLLEYSRNTSLVISSSVPTRGEDSKMGIGVRRVDQLPNT
jgi:hypothetical protein